MYQIATNCNTPPTYPPITSATHCNTIQQAATRWNCQSSKSFCCSMPRSIGYFCVRACLMVLNPSRAANQDSTLVENSSLRHSPTQVSFHGTHTQWHTHTHTHTHTRTHIHTHTRTRTHTYTHTQHLVQYTDIGPKSWQYLNDFIRDTRKQVFSNILHLESAHVSVLQCVLQWQKVLQRSPSFFQHSSTQVDLKKKTHWTPHTCMRGSVCFAVIQCVAVISLNILQLESALFLFSFHSFSF